jgi:hypothetical protein
VTLDIEATDVEVYGRSKAGCACNYQGQRAYRPDIAFWAELGVPVAVDLLSGNGDPRTSVVGLLRRALAGLPDGVKKVRVRMDAGYFAGQIAGSACSGVVGFKNPAVCADLGGFGCWWLMWDDR